MKFESGHHKLGGRKKGTPNKVTALREKLEDAGFDPFEVLIEIAKDKGHPDHFHAAKELCQYLEAKKKAIEVAGENKEEIRVTIHDYCSSTSGARNQSYLVPK